MSPFEGAIDTEHTPQSKQLESDLIRSMELAASLQEKVSSLDYQLAESEALVESLRAQLLEATTGGRPKKASFFGRRSQLRTENNNVAKRALAPFRRKDAAGMDEERQQQKIQKQEKELKVYQESELRLMNLVSELQNKMAKMEQKHDEERELADKENRRFQEMYARQQIEIDYLRRQLKGSKKRLDTENKEGSTSAPNDDKQDEGSPKSSLSEKGEISGFHAQLGETKKRLMRLREVAQANAEAIEENQRLQGNSHNIMSKVEKIVGQNSDSIGSLGSEDSFEESKKEPATD